MAPFKPLHSYDLIFAGGGFSAAITLIYMLEELAEQWTVANKQDRDFGGDPLKIAVFDKDGSFPKGLAYSEGKDSSAFLITPASEMMPPLDGGGNALTTWLSQNSATWADRLAKSRNAIVMAWLPALIEAVDRKTYNRAFLPRSVFGWFIEDLVFRAISDAETAGFAHVDILSLEVERVQRRLGDDRLIFTTATGENFVTNQLVVAIGSGNFGSLCLADQNIDCMITAPLEKGVLALRRRIEDRLQGHVGELGPKVLIIGSNASALDVISVLLALNRAQSATTQITSVSPSGQFPPAHRTITTARPDPDPCQALSALCATSQPLTARVIYDCALKDRLQLLQDGRHIGEAKVWIFEHVLNLIERLGVKEKREFVEVYGNDLSQEFYMTSPIYAQLYRDAIETGQVNLISGKVTDIRVSGQGADVSYQRGEMVTQDRFDLVIDCSGFEFPLVKSSVPLVRSLFDDLDAEQNRSGRGFKARPESFEIAQNVFVVGPLYAGNVDPLGVCRWHLETTRGISEVARICANNLASQMFWKSEDL